MTTPNKTQDITFWFDVTCPFCWMTSRWIKEVEEVRDIKVNWVPMSLGVLNEGRDHLSDDYKAEMKMAWGPARIFAAVATKEPEKVDALYTAMGSRIHNGDDRPRADKVAEAIPAALDEVGLDASYAEVAEGDSWDKELRAFHQTAMDEVGDEVGTPVIKFGEHAFFGPVITRLPKGEEAGEIFDAAARIAQFPYFFEIKRSRTEGPQL